MTRQSKLLPVWLVAVVGTTFADAKFPSLTGKTEKLDARTEKKLQGALRGKHNRNLQAPPQPDVPPPPPGYYPPEYYMPPPPEYYMPPPPEYYRPGKGKGNGMMGKGNNKGKGKGGPKKGPKSKMSKGKGKGYYPEEELFPAIDEIPFLDPSELPDGFWAGGDCRLVTFNESFYFRASSNNDTVGGSLDNVGSRFFFQEAITRPDGEDVEDVILSGVCTRTQAPGTLGTDGAGTCELVCADTSGAWSLATQGYLHNALVTETAGDLVVTGGSGQMTSVVGEMTIQPFDEAGMLWTGDIFVGPTGYMVEAAYGLIICPDPKPLY